MLELVLVPLLLAAFISGLFFIARVDRFLYGNRHLPAPEDRRGQIRIGAESPMLFDSVASAVDSCVSEDRYTAFSLFSGGAGRLMEMLSEGSIDVALLNSDNNINASGGFSVLRIPRERGVVRVNSLGLPVKWLDEEGDLAVVWNRSAASAPRDKLIFALEKEHCSIKCGYADYLEPNHHLPVEKDGDL